MHLLSVNQWQRRQAYTTLERQSLQQIVLGKLHNYMQKNEIRLFFSIIHKNKLKMGWRPKCETGHCKTPRGKHRQNTFWHKPQQYLFQSISQNNGNKKQKQTNGTYLNSKAFIQQRKQRKKQRQPADWGKIFAQMMWPTRD